MLSPSPPSLALLVAQLTWSFPPPPAPHRTVWLEGTSKDHPVPPRPRKQGHPWLGQVLRAHHITLGTLSSKYREIFCHAGAYSSTRGRQPMRLVRALRTARQGSVSLFPSLQTWPGCPPAMLPPGSGVCQDHSCVAGRTPGLKESKCVSPSSQQGDAWHLRGVQQGLASTSPQQLWPHRQGAGWRLTWGHSSGTLGRGCPACAGLSPSCLSSTLWVPICGTHKRGSSRDPRTGAAAGCPGAGSAGSPACSQALDRRIW